VWKNAGSTSSSGLSDAGTHRDLFWPDVGSGTLDRTKRRSRYEVVITYRGDKHTRLNPRHPEGETVYDARKSPYLSFGLGDPVIVELTNLGIVSGVWRGAAMGDPSLR